MDTDLDQIVNIFKALACETRLKIVLGLLEKKECNVNLMAEKLGLAQPNVSQHLAVLKNAKVIEGYRHGTQICYRVVDEETKNILKALNVINR
ncbi:MAG: metalloregulator ArsR/SmtB family transcription factor [Candidatus Gastranaerophilales bacterium]|nr:metalloregulator ArsR/SmtB family transcription factor [Candidatus Gastranaerophilales bacterium]